jgi:lysozyme
MTDQRTQLFDAIRPLMPGQRFTPAMVKMVDDLADRAGLPRLGTDDWLPYALALIKEFEGCKLTAYPDPGSGGDPWTIGWGSTGPSIKRGVVWTQEQADQRLAEHVAEFARGVDKLLNGSPVTAAQKGALVSLAYNVGLANLGSSTLLLLHKAGEYADAAMQFGRWTRASGKVLVGLQRRREAEAAIYRG